MLLEFVVPSLRITVLTHMSDDHSLQWWLNEILELEEDELITMCIHMVEKQ